MAYRILGIESSCDETAAAIVDNERGVLSSRLFSQIKLHQPFGGVVPEIASRSHLDKIPVIVQEALQAAKTSLDDINALAVTTTPGLPGSLLIGLCFAKGISLARNLPLIGVNHLEGHIFSPCIEHDVPFPHLSITASGGHTALYLVHSFGKYKLLGQTLDDAAGEAFDKVAKLIGLDYPGGPAIERYAREVDFKDFFKYPRNKLKSLDFSFSGLKTAVFYDLVKKELCDFTTKKFNLDAPNAHDIQHQVASSLLVCIADIFKQKLAHALAQHPEVQAATFAGGVACNKYIKQQLQELCDKHQTQFFTPSPQYCTDNAAMIAFVGQYKARNKEFSNLTLDIF
ncbi:tRNA (adenosine(37)-N6)-threonylcarbamoyltransferase complex transferase subunit TsaD [Candidatus Babeliales bacterium]|nr:tRNA (adenosine(37)-N6)-threonylcarbamoyltransferase complex transferase subunit TsaD [Candidatus Babeliales bacterium]